MARINIEDSIYQDLRFLKLLNLCDNDLEKTLGRIFRAWSLAQKWYLKTPDRMIPVSEWEKLQISNTIIDVGLAERFDDRIRIRGADEQFAWLLQKSNGGRANREIIKESVQRASTGDVGRRPLTLSLSSVSRSRSNSSSRSRSNSDSNSDSNTKSNQSTFPPETVTPQKNGAHEKIAYFCDCWKKKYSANYAVLPKEAGLIGRSFKGFGQDKFQSLVDAYFQMHDSYFLTKRHDVTTLVMNLAKVSHFAQTGVKVSRHDINQIEIQEHNTNVFTKIAKERAASET